MESVDTVYEEGVRGGGEGGSEDGMAVLAKTK